MRVGLSTRFSVRGGPNIYMSQRFSHSVSYCCSEAKHLLLCLVLRTEQERRDYGKSSPGDANIHILPIPDTARVLPVYHVTVKYKARQPSSS